ncbi:Nte1p [Saccharomyces cerevisiae YJM1573]|nr:Nte1p [Saccharomyces cerevisiae YJM1202]AJS81472.1 Nte1p [Saccharomyces cerevisiae YJM1273]AJS91059.1 Nte1p [Saccharomyces cerevisiae YJM1402]AJS92816.1 Nte1p [Saccharomyces cerevisiae YJM1419]AJS93690.1 Nte1p [Saccharomyces cerevisiae YJM1434]AJS94985.1 Nte1p [Saccharomyces cerevisiae YJM1444]AJS99327.1 Nte1p [Saccharomyces cerevisiae YJM1549]AJS99768.1 Nte1p [Saccharomyces cerevisiae YJM1573]CAD6640017.1 BJ4_G0020390.mRNA.1.CDS.1 [Saccharomyces cerevisiae]
MRSMNCTTNNTNNTGQNTKNSLGSSFNSSNYTSYRFQTCLTDQIISEAQTWSLSSLFNFSWVVSYFVMGASRMIFRYGWYLATLSLLRIPKWIFFKLHHVQFTLSFWLILFALAVIVFVTYTIMKERILSQYKRLTPEFLPLENTGKSGSSANINAASTQSANAPPAIGSSTTGASSIIDSKKHSLKDGNENETFLSSYLDQFLSAIKIFGYLEKPVFHDLTKNMKTQKMDEGEILLLDSTIGFAIVVEGTLQLYHEVDHSDKDHGDETDHSDTDGLDDQDRDEEDEEDDDDIDNYDTKSCSSNLIDEEDESVGYIHLKNGLGKFQLLNTVKPGNPLTSLVSILNLFTHSMSSYGNSNFPSELSSPIDTTVSVNNMFCSSEQNFSNTDSMTNSTNSFPTFPSSMPKLVARAATDCTIGIIPPQSFAKLTAKYPRSASHIIQMVLTKLYHVTFQTAHDYLGLTKEIMDIEVLLNKSIVYELPYYLKEAVIRKFKTVDKSSGSADLEPKPKNSNASSKLKKPPKAKPSDGIIQSLKIANANANTSSNSLSLKPEFTHHPSSRHVVLGSRDQFNPGDLLSNVPLSRTMDILSPNPIHNNNRNKSNGINTSTSNQHKRSSRSSSNNASVHSKKFSSLSPELRNAQLSTSPLSLDNTSVHDHIHPSPVHLKGRVSPRPNLLPTTSFSAAQEETEDSALRMALVEAMLTYLGVNKSNMSVSSSSIANMSSLNSPQLNEMYSRRPSNASFLMSPHCTPSDISVASSFASPQTQPTMLRILPKEYTISNKRHNKSKSQDKKKPRAYKEELTPNLDFEDVKKDFAQGIQLKFFKKGTTIVEQNARGKGLFYIISGKVNVTTNSSSSVVSSMSKPEQVSGQSSHKGENPHHTQHLLYSVGSGGIVGYLSSLIGYKSFVNIVAKSDVYVGFLSSATLERLFDKYFLIYLRISDSLTKLLSSRLLKLDHALEWVHLRASETLFSQGDSANGIYVVLNGRLRQLQQQSLSNSNTSSEEVETQNIILGELAQGESFGEVEVLTAMNRYSTIVAVRDSELARIPRTLFELLALEHPSIMIRVSRLVAKKIVGDRTVPALTGDPLSIKENDFTSLIPPTKASYSSSLSHKPQNITSGTITFRTITILPITSGLPVEAFAMKLVQAFKQVGRTTIGLNQRTTLTHLGRHAFDRLSKLKQSGYFAELEEMYQTVVYISDTPVKSNWTRTCIAQGDCILLLADARSPSAEIGEYEKLLLNSKTTARTELILLHPERYVEPGLTHKWLRYRPWVHSHHHIQFSLTGTTLMNEGKMHVLNNGALALMDKLIQTEFSRKTQQNISKLLPDSIKNTVENFSSRFMKSKRQYYTPVHRHKNDFLRLARILSGQAIGLVLGGGGARGISHLGVIQAIEEQGIPVDVIGGTSIGSFVGGLYAKDYDLVPIYGRVKKFAGRISSIWRMLTDLTWPVTSYTTGHEFNRGIWKTFGDTRIEDFWIQYYCNSTNITDSVQEIHSFGYAWRYIRASMSLAGLLPPLEENGSMLLDGGYVDNLPVTEMRARGCQTIFAVDVGSADDRTPMEYGDSLNGFWIIFNRWNPFSSHPNIPNMAEIQVRLGYVASVNALEKAKNTPGVVYVRPPIEEYATLDFSKFEEIYHVGVDYGRIFLQGLIDDDKMPYIPGSQETTLNSQVPEFLLHRRNSI